MSKKAESFKKTPVKFTKQVKKFIIEKMSEGHTVAEIYKKWPDKTVKPNTVYKKSMDDPDWAAELDRGYTLWYYNKQEELDALSSGLASDIYPNVEFREAEAALKRRIDALKFSLGKMAPIMAKRFDKAQKVEVEGNIGPQIAIMNYYSGEDAMKLEKDVSLPYNVIEGETDE